MAGIVISDASPLIGLSIVEGLDWLPVIFGEVWIPPAVMREVLPDSHSQGEAAIRQAMEQGWLKVLDQPFDNLPDLGLDEGESACISIAVAHPDATLLIIDERAGRAVASEYGVKITGMAAVIGEAKKRGLIPSARQAFEQLHQSDFRISQAVIKAVLARVEEL